MLYPRPALRYGKATNTKIAEEGNIVDTEGEDNYRRRKCKLVVPTDGGEAINTEHMEALYASLR